MKKTLLGLFLVLGMASFANNKIELKGAYDLGGEYRFEKSSVKGKANAMEVGAEYRYEVTPGMELGAGVAYQAHKDIKNYKAEAYDSVPVYATAKYTFDTSYIYVDKTQNNITLTTSKNDGRNCESCSVELTHEQAKELADLLLKLIE